MSRLLMFSGGVESTALLTTLDPNNDYALTVTHECNEPTMAFPTADLNLVKKILAHYKFHRFIHVHLKHNYMTGMYEGEYQRVWLFPAAIMIAGKLPEVKELVFGYHADEVFNSEVYDRWCAAFSLMYPDKKVNDYLRHKTKSEHWDMIDDAVKPYVVSCYVEAAGYPHDPSTCHSCEERNTYCN